ncbi:FtsX-like permease family protein [Spiroplasma endosymbiont of Nebria brevicollis]|uniref:FtsX-like permease family protein n=1 Tax=Spiroplasma endosymbiont of Nebria brevicollis TaxID=3066284 RepID=UPI00313DEC45
MAVSYVTILFLPIVLGFGASFGLQFYLTTTINKIMFIPNSFVIISTIPSIISLFILPLILGLTLTAVFLMLISKPPLILINHNTNMKPISFKKSRSTNIKFTKKLMNLRLTLAFAKSNSFRITSAVAIFFVNIFVALFLLNFVYVYNYSTTYSNVNYTEKGNRLFNANNPNINQLLDVLLKDDSYDDSSGDKIWHWVSNEQFQLGINVGTYHEITDFSVIITDWYNNFISPNNLKIIANNPLLLAQVKKVSESLYNLLIQAIPFWKTYDTYPYLTFGFKIYNQATSIQYSTLKGKWETSLSFVNSQAYIVSYQTNDFPQWIQYQGENDKQSLIEFNIENDSYVNAIFPLQLAKQLHLKIGDTIVSRITNNDVDTLPWSQISFRVSGINNYNYFNQNVIVKQSSVFKYLIKSYEDYETGISKSSTIKITNYDNFINDMLVTDATPEICRNVSFVNVDNQYNIINDITLNGTLLRYVITNYGEQGESVAIINSLVNVCKALTIIVLIIAVVIILVLVNLMFQENKKDIISLKILGYSNNRITALIMLPYVISFMSTFTFSAITIYFLLQVTLQLLFQIARIWLLFSFSSILLLIFFFSVTFLMIFSYVLGHHHINNSRFNDVIMEN